MKVLLPVVGLCFFLSCNSYANGPEGVGQTGPKRGQSAPTPADILGQLQERGGNTDRELQEILPPRLCTPQDIKRLTEKLARVEVLIARYTAEINKTGEEQHVVPGGIVSSPTPREPSRANEIGHGIDLNVGLRQQLESWRDNLTRNRASCNRLTATPTGK